MWRKKHESVCSHYVIFLKVGFWLVILIADILGMCVEFTVTAVDSASKALNFLGLVEDMASEIHQVQFSYYTHCLKHVNGHTSINF